MTKTDMPPLIAGRYRPEGELGRGSFGTTYRAKDTRTGKVVAIKRLNLRDVDDWKSVELFEREALVLAQLDHPQIPAYVEFIPVAEDRSGFLVQGLAPGKSLRALLDDNRHFSEPDLESIANQLLEILVYLSAQKPSVVHRDIKPANIIMDDGGVVHLVDFGSVTSAAIKASTVGSTIAGTFGYMAPEQLHGTIEPRSDLYALGMTLISLLTGLPPTDLPRERLKPKYKDVASVSAPLAAFIDRLIEPVPDDRFASASHAQQALSDLILEKQIEVSDTDITSLIAARELKGRKAKRAAEQTALVTRNQASEKLSKRPDRVSVAERDGSRRIVIAPEFLKDKLIEQAPWGMGFAWLNPGVFIEFGLGALFVYVANMSIGMAILMSVVTWTVLLFGINLGYAKLSQRPVTLDITESGEFALYEGPTKRPLLFGRRTELEVTIDEPRPEVLGSARIEDSHKVVRLKKLTARDLESLRRALNVRQ